MFNFPQQVASDRKFMQFKAQRDPKSYLGLERMLLAWVLLMAFVVSTSLLLLPFQSVVAKVLQYVWLPFAAAGVVYATWKYYVRLGALQAVPAKFIPIGSDPWAYASMLLLIMAVLLSFFVINAVTWKFP